MKTIIEKLDSNDIKKNIDIFNKAAVILNNGGIVAFPTETVYGLGANALNPDAVKKIYEAKGRPSDNPLIVHICDIQQLDNIVEETSTNAKKLMQAFWPGPLTLIFKKSELIPKETSGGLDTVAVRFPKNNIAQALIKVSNIPIAAPSANSSGKPSPTKASHVIFDLENKIDMIIDGGSCEFGLESTIVDVSEDVAYLLRPGSITKEMIENIIGNIKVDKAINKKLDSNEKPKAPGMKYMHYSPNADVVIVNGSLENIVQAINTIAYDNKNKNIDTFVIATEQTKSKYENCNIIIIGDRENPETIAANLFNVLRKCDYLNIPKVYIEAFDENGVGMAIMNRLKKAAGFNIINV